MGFEITLRTYSTEQIKDKLKISLLCGELPDIFAVWGGNYPNYLFDAGACLPVEEYPEQADFQFEESYIEPYTDSHNYIIPCLVEAYAVLYYNQDLMNLMNLTAPDTWEDLIDINHTLTPGLCLSSQTEYADEAAELCLTFARKVNEINVTEYDYLDMVQDSGLTVPEDSPLPVTQLHQMVERAEKFTPFWYAILEKEDGDNWRNLTKKLLGNAISKDTFLKEAQQYLNFPKEIP